ncbi:Protein mab-21, partial [Bienertia sinuspersici]
WNLLFLYGSPYVEQISQLWDTISIALSSSPIPFVIQGLQSFIQWRANWELIEIPFHGAQYTWCNNREGDQRIYEHLNRAYVSHDWPQMYPEATIINFPITISNHSPIYSIPTLQRKKHSSMKLDAWCLDFEDVGNIRTGGSPMYSCNTNIKQLKYDILNGPKTINDNTRQSRKT